MVELVTMVLVNALLVTQAQLVELVSPYLTNVHTFFVFSQGEDCSDVFCIIKQVIKTSPQYSLKYSFFLMKEPGRSICNQVYKGKGNLNNNDE